MTLNDEKWDERLRHALHAQSAGRINVADVVQKRVRTRRRRIHATWLSAAAIFVASGFAWWCIGTFNEGSQPARHVQPKTQPAPIVKNEPQRKTIAEAFPPPVEQLDVIGEQQDALVAVLENWNEK